MRPKWGLERGAGPSNINKYLYGAIHVFGPLKNEHFFSYFRFLEQGCTSNSVRVMKRQMFATEEKNVYS